jgi:hypothetical protein
MTGVDFDLGSFEKTLRRNKACETKSVYSLHQIIKLYAETHSHAMNSLGEQQSLRYFSASGIPSMELISEWGNDFVPAETPGSERVEQGDKVNLVMRQMYLPNLPHDRRVAQITWQASHWFEDGKKSEVSHVTSCEAVAAGSADSHLCHGRSWQSSPLSICWVGSAISGVLKLVGKFNPVFAMTDNTLQLRLQVSPKRRSEIPSWSTGPLDLGSATAGTMGFWGAHSA